MDGKSRILSNKAYLVGAAMGLGDWVSRLEIGSGHKYWSIFLRLSFSREFGIQCGERRNGTHMA